MSRLSRRNLAIGAFALLLITTPFLPDASSPQDAVLPSGSSPAPLSVGGSAGPGAVTPAMQAEIDAVVGEGLEQARRAGRVQGRQVTTPTAALVAGQVRCAEFEDQRYCLHLGWTTQTEAQVQARFSTAARTLAARRSLVEQTGDLDLLSAMENAARLAPKARADAERRELTEAASSVAKVLLLRHQIEGAPLPADFLARHPEARGATTPVTARSTTSTAIPTHPKKMAQYPQRATVMSNARVAEQTRSYWCGPATMQMIAWNWKKTDQGQAFWASKLGTTTSGSAITQMVRLVNASTGYDRPNRAGTYIPLDIGDYSFRQWKLLIMRHIDDYRAPVVLHPILLKAYYPYLDDDASGHFQAGRGYDKNGGKRWQIGYFEPWNQQRFDPSEPHINRVQWRSGYRSYRANKAHFQHNIGV